jgi:hypothetical protein
MVTNNSLNSIDLILDFGVNDGGKDVPNIPQRRKLYRSFIDSNLSSLSEEPSSSSPSSLSTPKDEIFHTFVIGESPAVIRFILLDTRSYRDPHWLRSLGEYKFIPFSALIAAGIRLIYSTLGFGVKHDGDVLGEQQWQWLESVLNKSTGSTLSNLSSNQEQEEECNNNEEIADFHVIVSSIQILTSNPVVESWGHYPLAKKRFMNLLQKYDPSGVVFLSGDIHASEISTATVHRVNSADTSSSTPSSSSSSQWYEVTSSGLTHTCRDNFITKPICPLMMDHFSSHRYGEANYFMERNVGVIRSMVIEPSTDTDIEENGICGLPSSYLMIDIYPLPLSSSSIPVLQQKIYPHQRGNCHGDQHQGRFDDKLRRSSEIIDIEYVSFPQIPILVSSSLLLGIFILLNIVVRLWDSQLKRRDKL